MPGPQLVDLRAGHYGLQLNPAFGGSVARFDWSGEPVMRAGLGSSIFDTACFPLVPFSNRIAQARLVADGRAIQLAPNFPGRVQPHAIHGFGWLAAWEVVEARRDRAILRNRHPGGEWPWSYIADQHFELSADGLRHSLVVRNLGPGRMPAGLGLHPYFPRTPSTRYVGLHRGEWINGADELPLRLNRRSEPHDWWEGRPVATRLVDTVYCNRAGPLQIEWPERGLALTIDPCAGLPHTVVYVPDGEDYFCVEPVSHETDAINRPEAADGLVWLDPGEQTEVAVRYVAERRTKF